MEGILTTVISLLTLVVMVAIPIVGYVVNGIKRDIRDLSDKSEKADNRLFEIITAVDDKWRHNIAMVHGKLEDWGRWLIDRMDKK